MRNIIPIINEVRDNVVSVIECAQEDIFKHNSVLKNIIISDKETYKIKTNFIYELYKEYLIDAIKSIVITKYSFKKVQIALLYKYDYAYIFQSCLSLKELLTSTTPKTALIIKCIDKSDNVHTGVTDILLSKFTKFGKRKTIIKVLKDIIYPDNFLQIKIPKTYIENIRSIYTPKISQYLKTNYNIETVEDIPYCSLDLFTVCIKPLDEISKSISSYGIGMESFSIDINDAISIYNAFKANNMEYLIKRLKVRFNDIRQKHIKKSKYSPNKIADGFEQLSKLFRFLEDRPPILYDLVKDAFKYVFDEVSKIEWLFDSINQYEHNKDFFFDDLYTRIRYYTNLELFLTVIDI
ncbi:MAG TPA: hypothetical protein PKG93_01675 [Bacilli bacterium]|nr:hypothetical protein [Bacilli bacterium]